MFAITGVINKCPICFGSEFFDWQRIKIDIFQLSSKITFQKNVYYNGYSVTLYQNEYFSFGTTEIMQL